MDRTIGNMFVPLFRVERIFLDEPAGTVKSYAQRFAQVVGREVVDYLQLSDGVGTRSV